uniref:Uncharacterized protein n=1 Tax=Anas platyrhynchos platyrhynchos TaxID=8840 RepID=A0A493TV41_ANAPP
MLSHAGVPTFCQEHGYDPHRSCCEAHHKVQRYSDPLLVPNQSTIHAGTTQGSASRTAPLSWQPGKSLGWLDSQQSASSFLCGHDFTSQAPACKACCISCICAMLRVLQAKGHPVQTQTTTLENAGYREVKISRKKK